VEAAEGSLALSAGPCFRTRLQFLADEFIQHAVGRFGASFAIHQTDLSLVDHLEDLEFLAVTRGDLTKAFAVQFAQFFGILGQPAWIMRVPERGMRL